jgi:hypothetical protein
MIEWIMNRKGYGRKRSWLDLRYYTDIYLQGLRTTMIKGRIISVTVSTKFLD